MSETAPPLSIERKNIPGDRPTPGPSIFDNALYSFVALMLSVIVVHSFWTLVIRPRANAVLSQEVVVTNSEKVQNTVLQLRSIWVILKDHEQEGCVALTMWSLLLLLRQALLVRRSRSLLDREYVNLPESRVVLPEDARAYSRPLEDLPKTEQDSLLPRLIISALNRFGSTRSVQNAAEAVRDECEFELSSLDTKLSMVRFTAWAIPAVGFVGTVRGIGAALQEAQGAMGGDISGVTLGLGITFNATLTALVCCIIVMFVMHQLQQAQDQLVLDSRNYVDRKLLRKLRVTTK
jgi:biopolymer transport protein ExbB/TolQ